MYHDNKNEMKNEDNNEYYEDKDMKKTITEQDVNELYQYDLYYQESVYEIDQKIKVNFVSSSSMFICRLCDAKFYFNNKLYKHVRQCSRSKAQLIVDVLHTIDESLSVIEFSTSVEENADYNFRR